MVSSNEKTNRNGKPLRTPLKNRVIKSAGIINFDGEEIDYDETDEKWILNGKIVGSKSQGSLSELSLDLYRLGKGAEFNETTYAIGQILEKSGYIFETSFSGNQTEQTVAKPPKKRNPAWVRDELILALDLYFRCPPSSTSEKNPEIIALSQLLNSLPIHPQKTEYQKFRNPSGVYMKLCNFLRFDPNYEGSGLKAGGKLEEKIWNEFYKNKNHLKNVVQAIISNASAIERPTETEIELENEEFQEGKILTKLHKTRERSPGLSQKKKSKVFNETGKLACEICGFDFLKFYGEIGQGFAECHHTKPVSELKKNETTKLKDLSIVCANCHRIIHRTKPMLTLEGLKLIISRNI